MIFPGLLTMVPATVALARAEIGDRVGFARLLAATVPANWPPGTAADALPLFLSGLEAAPDRVGCFGWYALTRADATAKPVLVGGGGFLGPLQDGCVKIRYSALPQYQRQGYATEMVGGLVRWAFAQPEVSRIRAGTDWANPASVRVLEKVGFSSVGPATEAGVFQFELLTSASDAERIQVGWRMVYHLASDLRGGRRQHGPHLQRWRQSEIRQ